MGLGKNTAMKFGIFDHLDRRDEPLKQFFDERLAFVSAAEEVGFHGYHIAEHHGTPLGMAPSPSVYLAAVASRTERLRFGPMMYLLPLYDPLRLVEEIGMLDNMSGGRLELGVGRGVSPHEIGFFGIRDEESFGVYAEALEVILEGLNCDRLNWDSARFHYDDVPMVIPPVQKPMPLWCAPGSLGSQEFAARYGMHIVSLGPTARIGEVSKSYLELWDKHAGDPLRAHCAATEPVLGAYRLVYVADTDDEAERIARPSYRYWFDSLAKLWRERGGTSGLLQLEDYDFARDMGMIITGSPARVREVLARQIEESGANYPILQFCFGDLGHAREVASLRMFAEEVMPAFADA